MGLGRFFGSASLSAMVACGLLAGVAQAQDAPLRTTAAAEDTGGLQDIVVTAQKREQNLQKVGISVTAISGQQILQRGISNSIDLITRTPSVDNY